jgi:hypothetical protein
MNPEEKEALKHIEEVSEQNNRILRGIQRKSRLSTFISVVKWVIIIGISIKAFYFLQPVLENLEKAYGEITGFHFPSFK